MKAVTNLVLVLSTSLVAFFGTPRAEKATFPLEKHATTVESTAELHSIPAFFTESDSVNKKHKKEYHIFFENRSTDKLEVAIRYKAYNGQWTTMGFESLKPGETKMMGTSDEQTYFYYASTQHKWNKREWSGKYKFSLKESAKNRLGFKKQDIWECYDTEMCKAYAVFK